MGEDPHTELAERAVAERSTEMDGVSEAGQLEEDMLQDLERRRDRRERHEIDREDYEMDEGPAAVEAVEVTPEEMLTPEERVPDSDPANEDWPIDEPQHGPIVVTKIRVGNGPPIYVQGAISEVEETIFCRGKLSGPLLTTKCISEWVQSASSSGYGMPKVVLDGRAVKIHPRNVISLEQVQ